MARILHLSTVHPATDPRILEKEAASLAAAGHEVTLIARPAKGAVQRGRELGVTVDLLPPLDGRRRRLLDQIGLVARIQRYDPELTFIHDPELLPFANWFRRRGGGVVYDAHEDLPLQLLSKPWLPPWARMPLAMTTLLAQKPLLAGLDGRIAATEPVADSLGLPTTIVRNFPDLKQFPKPLPQKAREKLLVYVGGLSEIRGLREMVGLLERLPGYRLRLVGSWASPELRSWAKAQPAWDRIEATGPLPHQEALRAIAPARLGLCLLHPRPNYLEALPTKLFEYMALGIPVLASNFPLWRDIVEGAGCGGVADPLQAEKLFAGAREVLAARGQGKRGFVAVQERYSWQAESARLVDFVDDLLTAGLSLD